MENRIITVDEYIQCQHLLDTTDNNKEPIDQWIDIVSLLYNTNANYLDINTFENYQQHILNIFNTDGVAIDSFIHNNETYVVDKTVLNIKVALWRAIVMASADPTAERFRSFLKCLVYKEGEPEEFTFDRFNKNSNRLNDLNIVTGLQIINFFLNLQQYCINLFQGYLKIQPVINKLQEDQASTEL